MNCCKEILSILNLLGFDTQTIRKKYCLTTPIDATLFTRPNPKTFEVIIHFLLDRAYPDESKKVKVVIIEVPILTFDFRDF